MKVLKTKMVGQAPDARSLTAPPEIVYVVEEEPSGPVIPWQATLVVLSGAVMGLYFFAVAIGDWMDGALSTRHALFLVAGFVMFYFICIHRGGIGARRQ